MGNTTIKLTMLTYHDMFFMGIAFACGFVICIVVIAVLTDWKPKSKRPRKVGSFEVHVDPTTGVQYLQKGSRITPRLGRDGRPLVEITKYGAQKAPPKSE